MFGEVPMLSKEELGVYKNRIFLPSWTKAEEKETLVLSYCDDGEGIKIQTLDSVKDIFDGKKGEDAFNDFIISCISTVQVSSQRRLNLGIEICEKMGISDSVYLVGFYNHVRLYPSKEKFENCFKTRNTELKK